MTRRRPAAIGAALLLLLGILVAAGCGGDDSGDGAAAEVVSVTSEPEHLGHTGTVPFEGGTISPMREAPPLVGEGHRRQDG